MNNCRLVLVLNAKKTNNYYSLGCQITFRPYNSFYKEYHLQLSQCSADVKPGNTNKYKIFLHSLASFVVFVTFEEGTKILSRIKKSNL